jgi:hypothetical protein
MIRCSPLEICIINDSQVASCISRSKVMLDQSNELSSIRNFVLNVRRKRSGSTRLRLVDHVDLCGTSECRFGECEMRNETQFMCHCIKVNINTLTIA